MLSMMHFVIVSRTSPFRVPLFAISEYRNLGQPWIYQHITFFVKRFKLTFTATFLFRKSSSRAFDWVTKEMYKPPSPKPTRLSFLPAVSFPPFQIHLP